MDGSVIDTDGARVGSAPSKRKGQPRPILGDRSSREQNDENAAPAPSAPSTPAAAGTPKPFGTRGRIGPSSLQTSQQAFIQAANSKKGHPQTPISAPPPGRGGASAANQLIVSNRELRNRTVELESLLRTSEEEKTQLRQRLRDVEAHAASHKSKLQNALAEHEESRGIQQAKLEAAKSAFIRATAETTEAKFDLDSRSADLQNAHHEQTAALARAEAAEASATNAFAEVGEMKKTLEAQQKCLDNARAAMVEAKGEAMAAEGAAVQARKEMAHAKKVEMEARTTAVKSQDENVNLRKRLECIAAYVGGSAPVAPVVTISGRKRGRAASRWAPTGRYGGRGGGGGHLPQITPVERGANDDNRRARFMEELCELLTSSTGYDFRTEFLKSFLAPPSSLCFREDKEDQADDDEIDTPAPVGAMTDFEIADDETRDAPAMLPTNGIDSQIDGRSLSRMPTAKGAAEENIQQGDGEKEQERAGSAHGAKQDKTASQALQSDSRIFVTSECQEKLPVVQNIQRPESRNRAPKTQKAGRQAVTEKTDEDIGPAQQRQRPQRRRRANTSSSATTEHVVAAVAKGGKSSPSSNDLQRLDHGSENIASTTRSLPAASDVLKAEWTDPEEHDEFGVEEVPMPIGGGENDTFIVGGDGLGLFATASTEGTPNSQPSDDLPAGGVNQMREMDSDSAPKGRASSTDALVEFVIGGQAVGATEPEEEAITKWKGRKRSEKDASRTTRRRSMRQMEKSAIIFREEQEAERHLEAAASAAATASAATGATAPARASSRPKQVQKMGLNSEKSKIESPLLPAVGGIDAAAGAEAMTIGASPVPKISRMSIDRPHHHDINVTPRTKGPLTRALTSPETPRLFYGTGASTTRGAAAAVNKLATASVANVRKASSSLVTIGGGPRTASKLLEMRTPRRADRKTTGPHPMGDGNHEMVDGQHKIVPAILPFSCGDVLSKVAAADIENAAKDWFGDVCVPGGALACVVAAARVLAQKVGTAGASEIENDTTTQRMRLLFGAFVSAESTAIRHGSDGGTTEAVSLHGNATSKGPSVRRLRFCAFDLSSVDMPSDARRQSDVPAKEIVSCLERVVAQSSLLQQHLHGSSHSSSVNRPGDAAAAVTTWGALMRGLRTVAVADHASPLVTDVRAACLSLGSKVSGKVIVRAARFLLGELEPLRVTEAPVQTPLRSRLASILSALVRFNLRRLLNPPPTSITKPPTLTTPGSLPQIVAKSTDHSDVHKLMQLVPDEGGGTNPNGAARDGATSAVLTMAISKLYGYSSTNAERLLDGAQAFLSENGDVAASGGSSSGGGGTVDGRISTKLSERDTLEMLVERAQQARQHLVDTVQVMAAINARGFVLALLDHHGVEDAIAKAGGWDDVEKFSSGLEKMKDIPDADAHLTLLSDMKGLKSWLQRMDVWPGGRENRAVKALKGLDRLIVKCAERRSNIIKAIALRESKEASHTSGNKSHGTRGALLVLQSGSREGNGGSSGSVKGITSREAKEMTGITLREAKELGQEARWQMDFPTVRAPTKVGQEDASGHQPAGRGAGMHEYSSPPAF